MPNRLQQRKYRVTWTVDVSGEDPRSAIAQAIDMMPPRPESRARVFHVREDGRSRPMVIDLYDEDDLTGQKVWGRSGSEFENIFAIATGATRTCKLHDCGQRRIAIQWPTGRLTYPCRDSLELGPEGYRIR